MSAGKDSPSSQQAPALQRDSSALAFSRRPAAPVAIALILGIALHRYVPHAPAAWIGASAGILLLAIATYRWAAACSALLVLATITAGLAAGQNATYQYPRGDISAFAADRPRLAEIELVITDPPRVMTRTPGGRGPAPAFPPKQIMQGDVVRVRAWNGWVKSSGRVLMQVNTPHPRLVEGQTVRVLGMLQRPAPAMNPGQFDWASYYREQRILTSLHMSDPGNIRIIAEPSGIRPVRWLRSKTRRLLAAGFTSEGSLDHALLRALLLGDNDPELRDVQNDFRRTGTSHHLAISGLHIAVLGGFIYLICRVLRLTPRSSVVIMILFVGIYGMVALPSPPVVRSVILCMAFGVGLSLRRSVDAIQLLALSVIAMLIYHPPDLFNAGFQLSFGTVLGLLIFTDPMQSLLRRGEDDPLPLPGRGTIELRRRAALMADRSLMTVLTAALVAWIVSLPLVARHFEQMNPWAVAAGLLLAPIVFAALVLGLLKIVLTLVFPSGAALWASVASYPIGWMRSMVDWLAEFPASDVPMPAPTIAAMIVFYLVLCSVLPRWRLGILRWGARGGTAAACLAMFFLPLKRDMQRALPELNRDLRVTFLAVGAGQCAVVEPPSGRLLLVDAGSTSLTDLLFKCLGPYLRHTGNDEIDTVLITHANYDHFSAVAELVPAYDVREVLTAGQFSAHAEGNPPAEAMLTALDRLNRPPRLVAPGDRIPLGRESNIEVLWPPPEARDLSANDASLVFRVSHGRQSMLFTGDIQDDAMRRLLETPEKLRADVLVAPHHGSSESLTEEFLKAVAPHYIISSNDRTLSRKQVRFDEIAAGSGATLLRTNRCGAISVKMSLDRELDVEAYLDEASEIRAGR